MGPKINSLQALCRVMARPEGVEQRYMLMFLFIFLSRKGNKAHFYPIKKPGFDPRGRVRVDSS